MPTSRTRPSQRSGLPADDRGQAVALGAIGLLILAIGMYLIGTFGHHVRQKISVQTTADASALSLATLEAQSFNYIAFANRAQVAHYVSMLNLQSFVSYVSFVEHGSIATANVLKIVGPPLSVVPETAVIGQAMLQLADVLKGLYDWIGPILDNLDRLLGKPIFDRLDDLNRTLWITELLIAEVVNVHLLAGGEGFFREIAGAADPAWDPGAAGWALNLLFTAHNVKAYNDAFSRPGGTPLAPTHQFQYTGSTSNELAQAQRIMTELVNASRYDAFLVKRGLLPLDFAKLNEWTDLAGVKRGESKLVDKAQAGQQIEIETILNQHYGDSRLSQGGVIASDDSIGFDLKLVRVEAGGSIWVKASPTTGGNSEQRHCRAKRGVTLPSWDTGECKDDGLHRYRGIAPYMSYQAGLRNPDNPKDDDFHQPDVFFWAFKPREQAGFPKEISFTLKTKAGEVSLDTGIARTGLGVPGSGLGLPKGIHALARAQVYYHRPGNWQEPPNLFNPFWRARLAPVGPGLGAAISDISGGADIIEDMTLFLGKNLIIH